MFGHCRATGLCAVVLAGLALAGCSSPTMIFDAATTVAEDRTMSQVATDAGLKIDINTTDMDQFVEGECAEYIQAPVHRCDDNVAIFSQRSTIRRNQVAADIVAATPVKKDEHRSDGIVVV